MPPGTVDAERLVWTLIDVSQGIKTECALQDAIFLGQELELVPRVFEFPVWPGIGTARYCEELQDTLASLFHSGRVYDTGGSFTLKAAQASPRDTHRAVDRLAALISKTDEATLSFMAAYIMARLREQRSGAQEEQRIRDGALSRLGWPDFIVKRIEKELSKLASPEA